MAVACDIRVFSPTIRIPLMNTTLSSDKFDRRASVLADEVGAPGSAASAWISRILKLALGVLGAFLVIRIAAALWLRSFLGDSMDELAKATGMDAGIAAWLRGFALTIGALSLAPWILRWFAGLTLPGFDSVKTMRLSLVSLAVSGMCVCSPPAIRAMRGLDKDDLPIQMERIDPHTSRWFAPSGKPLIAVSFERDGSFEFWNRQGVTPLTSTTANPVTPQIRELWENRETGRKAAELREKEEAGSRSRKEMQLREEARVQEEEMRNRKRAEDLAAQEAALRKAQSELEERQRKLVADAASRDSAQTRARAGQAPARGSSSAGITPVSAPRVEASEEREFPWRVATILPGKFLYIRGFKARTLEISSPTGFVIQNQGAAPRSFRPGVWKIDLNEEGNFRVSSPTRDAFEVRIRPASDR